MGLILLACVNKFCGKISRKSTVFVFAANYFLIVICAASRWYKENCDIALPQCVMLCYAVEIHSILCYGVLGYATLCYAEVVLPQSLICLCYAMLCYAMLCYAMPCYAMLCCLLCLWYFANG